MVWVFVKSETSAGGARFTLRNHYYFHPTLRLSHNHPPAKRTRENLTTKITSWKKNIEINPIIWLEWVELDVEKRDTQARAANERKKIAFCWNIKSLFTGLEFSQQRLNEIQVFHIPLFGVLFCGDQTKVGPFTCMRLNWRWCGEKFHSTHHMFGHKGNYKSVQIVVGSQNEWDFPVVALLLLFVVTPNHTFVELLRVNSE